MSLYETHFNNIKEGRKKVEIRVLDKKRKKLNFGDIIQFEKLPLKEDYINTKIIKLQKFDSFYNLYKNMDKKLLAHPIDITINEQIERSRQIYSKEKEKLGVLAIYFELISD